MTLDIISCFTKKGYTTALNCDSKMTETAWSEVVRTECSLCRHNPSHFSHNRPKDLEPVDDLQVLLPRTMNRRQNRPTTRWLQHAEALLQALLGLIWSQSRSPLILHHACTTIKDSETPVCESELQAGGFCHGELQDWANQRWPGG